MKDYIKKFMRRGLLAASGGPIIMAIICAILGACGVIDTLTPNEVLLSTVTVTFMAFVAAGIGVVYEIERLPTFPAALIHGVVLYLDYILIYLVNGWLRSQWIPVLIFTGCFITGYLIVWLIICLVTRRKAKQLSNRLPR